MAEGRGGSRNSWGLLIQGPAVCCGLVLRGHAYIHSLHMQTPFLSWEVLLDSLGSLQGTEKRRAFKPMLRSTLPEKEKPTFHSCERNNLGCFA